MHYEHPLGYVLGLEGLALLRAFLGDYGREFTEARIAEVRRLLDDPLLAAEGVETEPVGSLDGYRSWSQTYDEGPRNGLFDLDEPPMWEVVDALPPGDALDAGCGTGRHAEHLTSLGHRVVGVDGSPDMLAHARARVPDAKFLRGDLERLPLDDDSVDLVVCALALVHLPDLTGAFAEFARVLRPGGHLVVSDVHHDLVFRGSVAPVRGPSGERLRVAAYRHPTGDYLRAALPVGFQVRRCDEPGVRHGGEPREAATELGPWDMWPWSLAELVPEASDAAQSGCPSVIVWHFQLD